MLRGKFIALNALIEKKKVSFLLENLGVKIGVSRRKEIIHTRKEAKWKTDKNKREKSVKPKLDL